MLTPWYLLTYKSSTKYSLVFMSVFIAAMKNVAEN